MSAEPMVDVVIAVHRETRPIGRAVASALDGTSADVRVTVVAHHLDPETLRGPLGEVADDARVRVVRFDDGLQSPAGPKNHGLSIATGRYVSMLDSDDVFELGAIDSWLATAERDRADAVIAAKRSAAGRVESAPPVRVGRRCRLDGARDRLSYRTAVHGGLIRRARFLELRFSEGLRTGEDHRFTAELWFSGARVSYPVGAPGYRELTDQQDRVTADVPPVVDEFRYLDELLDPGTSWMRDARSRSALLVKLVRLQLFDAVNNRLAQWDGAVAAELSEVARRLVETEPRLRNALSAAEDRLLSAVLAAEGSSDRLAALVAARGSLRSPAALIPRSWWRALGRQAPLRTHLAGAMLVRTR
ncbi:glycosyltransferase family 2 protein [Leucobacter iarius]|uniref:Glycosyltransferase 2-like domain-containing protein n=1 Tax=Leucobacter iarius TaxID=333963 RepID=A0ABN2L9K4_9MICO